MSRQATNYGQEQGRWRDSTDRSSSLSSDLSHVTTGTCVGGGEEKIGKLTDISLNPIQRLGNVELTTQKLGSLSIIHCSAKLAVFE